jgi:putative membrane-bound dehydrogenase-like protein
LQKSDFAEAARTYHGCVDLLSKIPGNRPVAFRMPCCDSLNTPSPRFFAEIFNKTSPDGNFLSMDSSVFMIFTPDDPELPRDLVVDPDGRERFRKYLPFPSFVNTIENYPYPYVIGERCWEFPCIVPSDWEGQNIHKPNNPRTLEDMKAALDAVVKKQGVFNLVFHPHGWIRNDQVVELIDHAVQTHGKKVKFLNFHEALDRLNTNLLAGHPLRDEKGKSNDVEILDWNQDGYMDVRWRDNGLKGRVWKPEQHTWSEQPLPNEAVAVLTNGRFSRNSLTGEVEYTIDIDRDGKFELITADREGRCRVEGFVRKLGVELFLKPLPFSLPEPASLIDSKGKDFGLRFVDIDEDGFLDVVFSNDQIYGVYLFESMDQGWTRKVMAGRAGEPGSLPRIVRNGTDNGFFVHSRSLWWQNEDTASLPDLVDRRSFNDLLKSIEPRGKSPQASLDSIRVAPGFKVELMAAEPLVQDPIAFEWGADGKLWVVEMGDYPLGIDGRGKAGGVVRFLEDQDGDGRYDSSTVFLDKLGFPTGVFPWKKGVLVACAPEIFYAEDSDGDGKADHRDVLFSGFGEGNQQHRLNGFEIGLDGWIYGANGDSGGTIRSSKTGKSIAIGGFDFRFKPDTGEFEDASGLTQFGRHRDDWGNWFGNNNPNWGWHFVLREPDMRRNPHFAPPDSRHNLEPDTRLYPISRTLPRFNDPSASNRVTSANSPTPYRDELFGPSFASSLFVSEPVHNLVHRMVLEPEGVSFRGRRADDESSREFLASSDNWFRPTMLKTGPDGALWVSDMDRAVIEHPEWIPDDWEQKLDLRAGSNQGRLFRVYPVDVDPRPFARLDSLDVMGLVNELGSPNGWRRDTAMRLLLDRRDPAAAEPLRQLLRSSTRAQTRLQVVWTLACLDRLDEESALTALADPNPLVRRNAVEAAERLLTRFDSIGPRLVELARDPSPSVRLEVALRMGSWNDPRAGRSLAELARSAPEDRWMRAAVLSSATPNAVPLLIELLQNPSHSGEPPLAYLEPLLALAGASEDARGLDLVVKEATRPAGGEGEHFAAWQFELAATLRRLLEKTGQHPRQLTKLKEAGAIDREAREVLVDPNQPEPLRRAAIQIVGPAVRSQSSDRDLLLGLLKPTEPIALQKAAVASLAVNGSTAAADTLVRGWASYSPSLRSTVLDALLSRPEWTASLVDSLEDRCVRAAEIDPAHRQALLKAKDPAIRERAAVVFEERVEPRRAVVDSHRDVLALQGEAKTGKAIFEKNCATCHRLGGKGIDVGPDLSALSDKSPETLLVAILDPNRALETRYSSFTVAMTDGRVLSGLIASESGNAISLRRQEGQVDEILRSDIEQIATSGQSLMPEGLEKDLSKQELADLIAFIATATREQ